MAPAPALERTRLTVSAATLGPSIESQAAFAYFAIRCSSTILALALALNFDSDLLAAGCSGPCPTPGGPKCTRSMTAEQRHSDEINMGSLSQMVTWSTSSPPPLGTLFLYLVSNAHHRARTASGMKTPVTKCSCSEL